MKSCSFQGIEKFVNKSAGKKLLPSYDRELKILKEQCHPHHEVSDDGDWAETDLKTVAHQTAARLLIDPEVHEKVTRLKRISSNGKVALKLFFKTGMDGSSGHPIQQQGKSLKNQCANCMSSVFVFQQLVALVDGKMGTFGYQDCQ